MRSGIRSVRRRRAGIAGVLVIFLLVPGRAAPAEPADPAGNPPAVGASKTEASAAGAPETAAPRIVAGPCLQNPGQSTMTVVWMTDASATGWVEYGTSEPLAHRAVSSRDGLVAANERIHRVTIRGLEPGTAYRYRVVSKAILGFQPYQVTYGATVQSEVGTFATLDPRKREFSFVVLNDLHDKVDLLKSLMALEDRAPYDLVVLNGDIINDPQSEEQVVESFLRPVGETFASRVPFILARGNHETRGSHARLLRPFLRDPEEGYYGAFTHGGVRFLILDSGEDKKDGEPVYAGLTDFDAYRDVQRRWLLREVREPEFREARFRIGISHIPLFGPGSGHGATDAREKWGPILDAGGIDLHLSGHLHARRVVDPEPGLHDYPVVIGGAPKAGAATSIRVDVTPDELRVTVTTDDGKPVGSLAIGFRDRERAVVVPSASRPLTSESDARERRLLRLEVEDARNAPPEEVRAHPAALEFPGPVPAGAPRVRRAITVHAGRPGWHNEGIYGEPESPYWHGTGLYAAPGETIIAYVPPAVRDKGLHLRIGAHSDRLWRSDDWRRAPEICRRFPLTSATVRAASAFGGLVYIEAPFALDLGKIPVEIDGAVEAPRYVLGETSIEDWRSAVRGRPAPWAELETSKVILTIPSDAIRTLEDPEGLMRFWDGILDRYAELLGLPTGRRRPERFVSDVQISAGYMHSGYPLMTMLDIVPTMVDKHRIASNGHHGVWGLFHEIGHNHQSGDWTFDGTTEVTVNLFSLYVMETVCGIAEGAHPETRKEARETSIARHIESGADFARWKRDPFLALAMYIQLREAFGWEAFTKVFAEYRGLPGADRPRTDDEKRDQWLVRLSRTVGKDLGPFFQAWGVPTSEAARASISELPDWMPEGFPPARPATAAPSAPGGGAP